jgi:hypothetical protein
MADGSRFGVGRCAMRATAGEKRGLNSNGGAVMLGDSRLAPQSNSAPSSGLHIVVVDRKEGMVAEEMDEFFSGNRVLKESRDSQGQGSGHVGVPTFVKA